MRLRGALPLGLLLLAGAFFATHPGEPPGARGQADARAVEYTEEIQVRLVLLDVIVLDPSGRPVADLGRNEFEVIVGSDPVPLESLDVDCPAGVAEGLPDAIRSKGARTPRRIVLALDYQHLTRTRRFRVLEQVIAMVRDGVSAGDEIMVVALNGGLRIEQRFSGDVARTTSSLERMQYDISLWQPEFHHLNESGFVGGMTAMLEYLGAIPGAKAVVLFSEMGHVPLQLQFEKIAAVAAAARCSIYPVDVSGLVPVKPPEIGFPVFNDTLSANRSKRSGTRMSPSPG